MNNRSPRCFVHTSHENPTAVDKLRLAILNEDESLISSVWTVWPSHNENKPDFYAASSGMRGSHKFSFHNDIVNNSFLYEAHHRLIADGIIPDRSRHIMQSPVPHLPWFAMRVRFAEATLRRVSKDRTGISRPIVALPRPKKGHWLELGFLLCDSTEIEIREVDFVFGYMVSGERSLILVGREVAHDPQEFLAEIEERLGRINVSDRWSAPIDGTEDFSMNMYDTGADGEILVTEVHNLRRISRVQGSMPQQGHTSTENR